MNLEPVAVQFDTLTSPQYDPPLNYSGVHGMLFGLLPGTLDVLILKAIDASPNHGYGVARWIRDATDDALVVEDGALYTALHRLEHRGLLRADWKPSETKRRAKYYTLTAKGRRVLDEQTVAWRRSAAALSKVLDRAPRKASS